MDDPVFASAALQARAVATGAIGAEELLDAQLARLRAVDAVVP